jgi:hypothetical protein
VTYAGGTTISYVYDAAGNITTVNTTPQPPSSGGGGGGGCFIATAAYGSPLHPHVQALREFRDGVLLGYAPGRAFVAWYARVSPPLAALIAEHPSLRAPVRWALAPIVYTVAFPRTAFGLGLLLVLAAYLAWKRRRRMVGPSFGSTRSATMRTMKSYLLLLLVGFLAFACRTQSSADEAQSSAPPSAKPEVRYYVIADT